MTEIGLNDKIGKTDSERGTNTFDVVRSTVTNQTDQAQS